MEYSVIRLDESTLRFFPHPQQPFAIIGRLIPAYDGEKWTTKEELYAQPAEKLYLNNTTDPKTYVNNENEAVFLAIYGGECVGSILVCKRWNGNGFIDDFKVDRAHRRRGAAKLLMDAAVAWSKEKGLNGVSLETQSDNLIACRFYMKYGFVLGGIDTNVYTEPGYKGEVALYFYLRDELFLNRPETRS